MKMKDAMSPETREGVQTVLGGLAYFAGWLLIVALVWGVDSTPFQSLAVCARRYESRSSGKVHVCRRKSGHTGDHVDGDVTWTSAAELLRAEPSPTEEQFVVLAADDYARRCVAATGQAFQISELVNLKAWFYAGARWRVAHPGADVIGPQSSTMAPAEPSPVDAQPEPETVVRRGQVYLSPSYMHALADVLRRGKYTRETLDLVATIVDAVAVAGEGEP